MIDHYIVENNIDAPADDSELLDWQPPARASTIDLAKAGITSIIYAIGFRYDFGWIDLPIFDERGYPRYRRGVTDFPGFYFVGNNKEGDWQGKSEKITTGKAETIKLLISEKL